MSKKKIYNRIARLYDLLDLPFEHGRYRPVRRILFEGLDRGGDCTILDAGVGTGRNMTYYPAGAKITAIDLSPQMLARAEERKARLGVDVTLREMDVRKTDFPDGTFDCVIATFLFCVLDDDDQLSALKELRRICKSTGEIRIIEYAYSKRPFKRLIMKLWAPWVKMMYGATFDRDTERYVADARLDIAENRFLFEDIIKLLVLRPKA